MPEEGFFDCIEILLYSHHMTVEHLIDRAASGEEEYDKAVEHLVDTTGISYDEARLRIGEPPYELYTPQEASRGVVFGKEITRRTIDRPRRRSGHGGCWLSGRSSVLLFAK